MNRFKKNLCQTQCWAKIFNKNKKIISSIFLIFLLISDRWFKYLAKREFFDEPIKIINDFFTLNYVQNKNIAFSLPLSGNFLVVIIIFLTIGLLYYLLYYFKKNYLQEVFFLALIVLGAISNLADRIQYGFVIDYLDLKYFFVFNLADAMIVFGAFLFLLSSIKRDQKNKI